MQLFARQSYPHSHQAYVFISFVGKYCSNLTLESVVCANEASFGGARICADEATLSISLFESN